MAAKIERQRFRSFFRQKRSRGSSQKSELVSALESSRNPVSPTRPVRNEGDTHDAREHSQTHDTSNLPRSSKATQKAKPLGKRRQMCMPIIETALEQDLLAYASMDEKFENTSTAKMFSSQSDVISRHAWIAKQIEEDLCQSSPSPERSLPPRRSSNHPSCAVTGSYFEGRLPLRYYAPVDRWNRPICSSFFDEDEVNCMAGPDSALTNSVSGEGPTRQDSQCEAQVLTTSAIYQRRDASGLEKSQSLFRISKFSNLRAASQSEKSIRDGDFIGKQRPQSQQSHPSQNRQTIKRSDLQKPLPPLPYLCPHETEAHQNLASVAGVSSKEVPASALPGSSESPSNTSGENFPQDCRFTLCEQWAPAVTHQTVVRDVHEVREEHVVREIHEHHFYHRILPVMDTEVLPTRHVALIDGKYIDLREDGISSQLRTDIERELRGKIREALRKNGPVKPSDDHVMLKSVGRRSISQERSIEAALSMAETRRTYPCAVDQTELGPSDSAAIDLSRQSDASSADVRAAKG